MDLLKSLLLLAIGFSFINFNICYSFDSNSLNNSLKKALAMKLWEDPYWHLLLHTKKTFLLKREVSEVDGRNFFLSPNGQTDFKDELLSTIKAFYFDKEDNKSFQCLFPARFAWLDKNLNFSKDINKQECKDYTWWREKMPAKSATLILAGQDRYYPSSMFGHTLLRINAYKIGDPEASPLLNFGVNYASHPTTTNIFIYPLMGIFGGFPGYFSIYPYYFKIKEYNDWESRDIWEYDLNLNEDEIELMAKHLWELINNVAFRYFFFDENCSYHLLSLIEIARPSVRLREKTGSFVIPIDTISLIKKYYPEMVLSESYRPSVMNQLMTKRNELNQKAKKVFDKFVKKPDFNDEEYKTLNEHERMIILDSSIDYLNHEEHKKAEDEGVLKEVKDNKLRRELLLAISKNNDKSEIKKPPQPISPLMGHDSARATYTLGKNPSSVYHNFGWQIAYHDLVANDDGFMPGLEFEGLKIEGRYYQKDKKAALQELTFLDAVSLAPYDGFTFRPSWEFNFALENFKDKTCEDCIGIHGDTGFGASISFFDKKPLILFFLTDAVFEFQNKLEYNHRIGISPNAGFVSTLTKKIKLYSKFEYPIYLLGEKDHFVKVKVENNYSLSRNTELRLIYKRAKNQYDYGINFGIYY